MNKKIISMVIVSVFLSTGFITVSAVDVSNVQITILEKTIYVDDDNTAGPWDGTQEHPYRYIQDAVDNANNGDTVYVYNGKYPGVCIHRTIILQGENKETTIIDLNTPGEGVAVDVRANRVKISGFTITNAHTAINMDWINGGYSDTITGNILTTQNVSIKLWETNDNIISNNTMSSDWIGMYIYKSNRNSIIDNIITDSDYGMHLYSAYGNTIRGNTISNHIVGINFAESTGYNRLSLLLSNTFKNNGDNIIGLPKGKSISPFLLIEQLVDRFPLLERLLKLEKNEVSASGENDWPMFRHDASHTGYSDSKTPLFGFVKWSKKLGEYVQSSPAVVGGKLYVGSDNTLYCLNANLRGMKVWSKTLSGSCTGPAVVNEKVYVCGGSKVYCFNAETGDEIWSKEKGEAATSPTVCDGRVYVGSDGYTEDTGVWCLDAETGDLIWSFNADAWVPTTPAVANGKVYVCSGIDTHKGNLWCLDAAGNGDGTTNVIWKYDNDECIYSSPAVSNGKVYVGINFYCQLSDYGAISCFNADTGDIIWSYPISTWTYCSPAVADGRVYIGTDGKQEGGVSDGVFYCLDAETGEEIWSYTTKGTASPGGKIFSSPAVTGNKVYFSSWNGKFYCLNTKNGHKLWSRTICMTGFKCCSSSPAIANGRIYVGSYNGRLYCFGGLLI